MRYYNFCFSKIAMAKHLIFTFNKIPKYNLFQNKALLYNNNNNQFINNNRYFTTNLNQREGILKLEEINIISETLNKALTKVDFGTEIVIQLLNDKRSFFKILLEKNNQCEKIN
ncbi:hypothetical protein Mgra_00004660 [Meloidogyne graminicola]|uniref:Uncharacterized protein n=1 Tax=Meloidogyne graminicola TaxID=189291 RepID=A0A8S9ZR90_9BILA|nr:hypothetical protein Mgra_00004660 [Meloidogyne graminicola]